MSSIPILEVRGLSKTFGGVRAVADVSMSLEAGERVGLIGPNGAGKSTLVNLLSRVDRADAGVVTLDGQQISHLRPHEVARAGLVRTYQSTRLFLEDTVRENIAMVAAWNADVTRDGVTYPGSSGSVEDRVPALLELMSLTDHADDPAQGLDQQSQKRLVVAAALALTPRMLLLDEPFAGLTHEEAEDLVGVLNLLEDAGVTILLIDHNIRAVMNFCDRVYVLDHGEVLMEGSPAEVQADERVAQVYLRGER